MIAPLFDPAGFVGLDDRLVHLASGAEAPLPRVAVNSFAAYATGKASGMQWAVSRDALISELRALLGERLGLPKPHERLAFLSSASHGLSLIAQSLGLAADDEVLIPADEFPSGVLAFAPLQDDGVRLRFVDRSRAPDHDAEADIIAAVGPRTRVLCVSHVSYLTGRRLDLARLAEACRASEIRFVVDASHAAGAVAVPADACDALVSCAHKFLFGTHGTGLVYWNEERLGPPPPLAPGWNSASAYAVDEDGLAWRAKPGLESWEAGNLNFAALYALQASQRFLSAHTPAAIEAHAIGLAKLLRAGLADLGAQLLTPADPARHGTSIAFAHIEPERVIAGLAEQGVRGWASDGRVRLSLTVFHGNADVERALDALATVLGDQP